MSELITKIVGENIRQMRLEHKMTAAELAKRLQIAPQNLSGIEHGKRGLSTNHIDKVCEEFGCAPFELFFPPDGTDEDKLTMQIIKELKIMDKPALAKLFAHAVSINAQRGIQPDNS